ncbi:transient-receptor-potential-like protein [Elysia marginata]|uniref:Transient-receptor-potential-like protein n=1 Tax=Elysia marginata TaxID=1093978 RepID=A0AAV4IZC1_9GAST|nr:transient-receptor-potential-like protein [Elysia marginata]
MLREDWPQSDPTIISEGLFAIANVFSFARIIYLFQANQHLGPLQISLGCMLIDIAKFLFIFFLVVSSFACGLNQLYWYYNDSDPNDEDLFFTLFSSYVTLFWSMFSLTAPSKLEVRSTQTFTRTVGELMFMAYHGMAIIVLLNMLIAMMSSSFQEIENHADMEWKFARSKLWMGYFDEGSTLPAPFNMIISPKSVCYLVLWVKRVILDRICHKGMRYTVRQRKSSQGPVREVMRRLICRYIHHTKKEMRQSGVNADDLLEIKQDISSLRFELREDRKREVIRTTGHMDSLRRDLNQSIVRLSPIPSTIGTTPLVSPIPYFDNPALSQTSVSPSLAGSKFGRTQLDLHLGPQQSSHPSSNPNLLAPPVFDGRSSYSLATHSSFDGEASDARQLHSSLDFDCLKAEIVTGIRQEIRDALYQTLSVGSKQAAQPPGHTNTVAGSGAISLPPSSSDLYHTHLYTQL